ncbi:MAG: hypothetical protein ACKV2O_07925 [Acidimicrobiales bacterium]
MRQRLIIAVIGAALVNLVLACGADSADTPSAGAWPEQRIDAGAVTVTITPERIDADGAVFSVVLDTHTVELTMDLTAAQLDVDGTPWTGARWSGDGPNGHHRSGQLQFDASGTARKTATLTLPGFPAPVQASWDITGD